MSDTPPDNHVPDDAPPRERVHLFTVAPPKPVSEMTNEEYEAWVDAFADAVAGTLHGEELDEEPH